MGLIDRLQRAGGIIKNRLASAVGAIRAQARGISVRVPSSLRFAARTARLTSPLGLGIAAVQFAPQIRRGLVLGRQAVTRGIAFIGGQKVAVAAGAGATVGALGGRRSGNVTRPSEGLQSFPRRAGATRAAAAPTVKRKKRKAAARKKAVSRKRIPKHRHKIIDLPLKKKSRKTGKRATHRSPRHRGHKKVSFTTKSGQKVSFLANPKARHR